MTALAELREETGIILRQKDIIRIEILNADGNAYWEPHHYNFGIFLKTRPQVPVPEEDSRHEVILDGMIGAADQAGDRYHAWLPLSTALKDRRLRLHCSSPVLDADKR